MKHEHYKIRRYAFRNYISDGHYPDRRAADIHHQDILGIQRWLTEEFVAHHLEIRLKVVLNVDDESGCDGGGKTGYSTREINQRHDQVRAEDPRVGAASAFGRMRQGRGCATTS